MVGPSAECDVGMAFPSSAVTWVAGTPDTQCGAQELARAWTVRRAKPSGGTTTQLRAFWKQPVPTASAISGRAFAAASGADRQGMLRRRLRPAHPGDSHRPAA